MAERIIFRQNNQFEVEFLASDPRDPENGDVFKVEGLHEVTPYGMMLFSLASCTAQVILSYANHHQVSVQEVEFDLTYERVFEEDCENCQDIDRYQEQINESIRLIGDLSEREEEKLFQIAHQCPIQKMFQDGIEVKSKKV
ncbi:MAG: OsmC family protein [Anaerolineales bacterium]|nr:OsmC family protein [Anaerolineales bacterium]